jgi:glycosyltransferase involved in cell wall biosynthesis
LHMKPSRKRILHIITGLNTGGAEKMLTKLVCATDQQYFETIVVSLTDNGTLGESIKACNVQVYSIGMAKSWASVAGLIRLAQLIRRLQPDLIMGWMYHANIAAFIARTLSARKIPLLWNIRHTPYNMSSEKKLTSLLIRLSGWLSFIPLCVVYNSYVSLGRHEKLRFRKANSQVIPNGFDTDIFKPSFQSRNQARVTLGIPDSAPVLVHVARFHEMKDHHGFLHAASIVTKTFPDAWIVLIGRDVSWHNPALNGWLESFGLRDRILLLDERTDLPDILPAFDVLCLSSEWGEGFPNVIGEAMACGLPCVTTDVGDAGMVVGDTGYVVPPSNPKALADACTKLLKLSQSKRQTMGEAARLRIVKNYSLPAIVAEYQSLYERIIK